MAWTRADIRTKFRSLTGRSTTGEIADAAINTLVNDYYRYDLPKAISMPDFESDFTQELTATDSGEYAVSDDVIRIEQPIFINDKDIDVFHGESSFFKTYPVYEGYLTAPTLAIGSSDTATVANSAFNYRTSDYDYTLTAAAAETALSGDDVPQNKYGAWLIEIDSDRTISVSEADDNATGYDSAAEAIKDLPAPDGDKCTMGFVTVIYTGSVFVPGTTGLDTSGVTDTYTDGNPTLRGEPHAVLVDQSGSKLYVRPKPDDIYLFKSILTLQRPTAMSSDSDSPLDEEWGLAIALGASIKFLTGEEGDQARIAELTYGPNPQEPAPGSLEYELASIERETLLHLMRTPKERAL